MTVYVVIGGIVCAWVLLNLLGGERQQRLNRMKVEQLVAGAAKKPPDPHKSAR